MRTNKTLGILKQSLLLMCVSLCIADELTKNLRWVDHFMTGDKDIYFDRIVAIAFDEEQTVRGTGVLITRRLVLTTFNPFRTIVSAGRDNMDKTRIISLRGRSIMDKGEYVNYTIEESGIACGRQVLPIANDSNVWHMEVGEQSPLHDLMVLKLKTPLEIRNTNESDLYEFDLDTENETDAGPIVTLLAARYAQLGDDIKFASYGHINKNHINKGTELRSFEFQYDDHVQTDCDEWLPRSWGYFICLQNFESFPAIASGAVLVHKDFVYGLGSFLLEKGDNKSILVFTDVRPYLNLIFNACQNSEKKP